MQKYVVYYNPLSANGKGKEEAQKIEEFLKNSEFTYEDATQAGDEAELLKKLPEDVIPVFTGGDGTVNFVVNAIKKSGTKRPVWFFPAGSGNDFCRDIGREKNPAPFEINEYVDHLPSVTVQGKTMYFVDNVGAGIDGYCCEESDRLKSIGKHQSYQMIAVKGLLGKWNPVDAKVTVDGVTREYKKIYMAPVMFGRYYGGGIKIAPSQERKNPDHKVTNVVAWAKNRLQGVFLFLSILMGNAEKLTKNIEFHEGYDVKVEFSPAVAVQIDGETFTNVTEYEVHADRS